MKKYPFKFLDSYEKEDKGIYFGRDEEINSLYEMVFRSSIVLIYGASGTGKTSLINCGLAGKFQPHDWLSLMVRRESNINDSLMRKLYDAGAISSIIEKEFDWRNQQFDENATSPVIMSLVCRALEKVYERSFKPMYLIFDQFEELFILGSQSEQKDFIKSVQEILQSELPVKLIFSIREEYLGHLYEFERAIPQLLQNKLRIEAMNLEKVKQVIEGAAQYKDTIIKIKPGESDNLVQGIFDKIRGNSKSLTVQLPFLQVFLDKFYFKITKDKMRKTEAVFSLQELEEMGEIGDILVYFLEEQVQDITKEVRHEYNAINENRIWKILSPFSTIDGTKEPISIEELHARLPYYPPMIDAVVKQLDNKRILRYNENSDLYEITHDSLAKLIAEKRSAEDVHLMEVKRLITNQMAEVALRELFTEKQLSEIDSVEEKLNPTEEQKIWIEKSKAAIAKKTFDEIKKQEEEIEKSKKQSRKVQYLLIAILIVILIALFYAFTARAFKKELELLKQQQALGVALSVKMNMQMFDQSINT